MYDPPTLSYSRWRLISLPQVRVVLMMSELAFNKADKLEMRLRKRLVSVGSVLIFARFC